MGLDDENKSWVRDIAEVLVTLAVILVVLRLLLGAHMMVPLVAVVSCSMLHEGDIIGSPSYALAQVTYPILLDDACSYRSGRHWETWIKQRYLFSLDPVDVEEDMSKGRVSEGLGDRFKAGGYPLSEDATLKETGEGRWEIIDGGAVYIIQKEGWKLRVYRKRMPEQDIGKFPLKSGFSVGDMILVITPDGGGTILPFFSETGVGDVIIFSRDRNTGNEPIIHRVVGIVKVRDWGIHKVEGTLDCKTEQDFTDKYIRYVKDCQEGAVGCRYRDFPKGSEFEFYITKGDNNEGTDQCSTSILPVTDAQVTARGWLRIPYVGWLKLMLNRTLGVFLFFLR